MTGFIIKLIVCPLTVLTASVIFPNVNYNALYEPVIVGLILALSAYMLEMFFLKSDTFLISAIIDFIAATLIVYFFSLIEGATVTVSGAILTAILLVLSELVQHRWLIGTGRTQ